MSSAASDAIYFCSQLLLALPYQLMNEGFYPNHFEDVCLGASRVCDILFETAQRLFAHFLPQGLAKRNNAPAVE